MIRKESPNAIAFKTFHNAVVARGHGSFELEIHDMEITDTLAGKGFHEAPQVECTRCQQPPRHPYFKYAMDIAEHGLGFSESVTPMYSCACGHLEVHADFIIVLKGE
jgi:hypothetical protein